MAVRVYLDGLIVGEAEAKVSIFDRGFLYGDSVFEAFRTLRGAPLFFDEHLARLARSAAAVLIAAPAKELLAEAVMRTLEAATSSDAAHGDSYVRVIVSRGQGEIGLDPVLAEATGPGLYVLVKPVALPVPSLYEHGAKLAVVDRRRNSLEALDPKVKSSNYLNNILALAEARKLDAYEAVMLDAEGRVTEGTTSNVFMVKGGRLITPEIEVGILVGITRSRVLSLAREAGLEVIEARPLPEDLASADEVFITSSIRGVLPMSRVGERVIGDGRPGPVTHRLMALYQALTEADAAAFLAAQAEQAKNLG